MKREIVAIALGFSILSPQLAFAGDMDVFGAGSSGADMYFQQQTPTNMFPAGQVISQLRNQGEMPSLVVLVLEGDETSTAWVQAEMIMNSGQALVASAGELQTGDMTDIKSYTNSLLGEMQGVVEGDHINLSQLSSAIEAYNSIVRNLKKEDLIALSGTAEFQAISFALKTLRAGVQ